MYRLCIYITTLTFLGVFYLSKIEATLGYQAVGFGTKAIGMGGVATAYPQDSLVAATNPAGMYWVGRRGDIGLQFFTPIRKYSFDSPIFGSHHRRSGRNIFFIPHLGYNGYLNSCTSLGISVYGNGGLNTRYRRNNFVFGQGKLGADYAQAIFAPTIAYRICQNHTIGLALLLGAQRIHIYGLQNFRPFSAHPSFVSNKGYDYAAGIGVRVGWMGQIYDGLWLGAAYATKTYMTKFSKYRGILPEGKLDIPANLSVGFRYELFPCVNIAFDYERIFYKDVRALGNSISRFAPGTLGRKNAAGFGWRNISAYKVGMDYALNSCWIVRAGYAYGEHVYSGKEIDNNIIAPAVVTNHITVGATYNYSNCQELDIAYSYALPDSRTGISRFGLGRVKHQMYQHLIELNYGW